MKTLRFIGMAIVAIIMSVNFVACSDDDDDNPIVGTWRSEVDNYGYSDSMQTEVVYGKSLKITNKLILNHLNIL